VCESIALTTTHARPSSFDRSCQCGQTADADRLEPKDQKEALAAPAVPFVSDAPHLAAKISPALLCRRTRSCQRDRLMLPGDDWYVQGKMMLRSTQARVALTVAFAMIAISLAAASARAFSQESGGSGGSENSTFSDPDEQVNIFGQGAEPQSFGSSGSVQYDARQQGRLNAFKHPQINSLTSPPDPLSRPGN
jgi:hypothetical protein